MSTTSSYPSSSITYSTLLAIVSTTLLIYTQWKNAPAWIKRRKTSNTTNNNTNDGPADDTRSGDDWLDKDANDELADPTAVTIKLKQMVDLVANVTEEEETSSQVGNLELMTSFFSLLHLQRELLAKDPDYRDKLYEKGNQSHDVPLEELQELAEYLEYAHWAYSKSPEALKKHCRNAGFDLLTHDTATEPGRVGHYIALQHSKKLAIVGLKGTSTWSDILTDLIAIPKRHVGCYFDNEAFAAPPKSKNNHAKDDPSNDVYCHEGIFTAAIWMADTIQPMIENLLIPLNYKVVICGHSLGAGTACLLGLELRSRIPAFRKNYTDLRVLAFATPPVISYKASRACAPFVTSMVNNTDIITRCSISNLVIMQKLLVKVSDKLQEKGLALDSWTSLQKYYENHSKVDHDLLLTEEELETFFRDNLAAPELNHLALYVPGRCVVMWDKGENDNHAIGGIVTECGMKMLRQVELSLSLVTDHLVPGYRTNLHKLMDQLENSI